MSLITDRPWFQIHLSTTLFASFVAGTLMYLNYSAISSVSMWDYGLPFPEYTRDRMFYGQVGMRGGPITIGLNLAFNLGAVFVLASIFEFFTRRRFRLHAITWIVAAVVLIALSSEILDTLSSWNRVQRRPDPDMPQSIFLGILMIQLSSVFIVTFISEYLIRERSARRQPRSGEVGSASRRDGG